MNGLADRDAVIATYNLTKRYGSITALSDANLTVPSGTIYGFLGPNGAGKTTAIRLLMGFLKPSSGRAEMFGRDCWSDGLAARRDVGFLVTADALYPDMTGTAQLDYAARLSNRKPVLRRQLLDALELGQRALERRLGSYSKGMRQKLALIAAMQHDPALLILDEPTDGLDPLIQRNFEEMLLNLRDQRRTIFMSSHDLAEVERTCELVAVVRSGVIVAEERIADMQQRHASRVSVQFHESVPDDLNQIAGVSVESRSGLRLELMLVGDPNPLVQYLALHPVADLTINRASLEDIFMAYYEPTDRDADVAREKVPV
jgi:ABC-2 type transport system ATP-binding protein